MSVNALAQFGTKHVAKGVGRLATEVIESGSGSYVTMVGGRRMVSGIILYSAIYIRLLLSLSMIHHV